MLEIMNRPEFFFILLLFMFAATQIGRKNKLPIIKKTPIDFIAIGPVETSIFALLGLLLAFTFTGAWSRFEVRRNLILAETNAIMTAFSRIDILSKDIQPTMRNLLKEYTSVRAKIFADVSDEKEMMAKYNRGSELKQKIWDLAINDCLEINELNRRASLILPALNDVFALASSQKSARQNHPPTIIFLMLIILSLFSAFLVGFNLPETGKGNLMHLISYVFIITSVLFLIIDMELPRRGLISVHDDDQLLIELKDSM